MHAGHTPHQLGYSPEVFKSVNMGRTEEGHKEREGCTQGCGLSSVVVTCPCEPQSILKHLVPSNPAHSASCVALWTLGIWSVQVGCAAPQFALSMQWGCRACLPWPAVESAAHLASTQCPESQAPLFCVTGLSPPFWVDQLFQDDFPAFVGFSRLIQAASHLTPREGAEGRSKVRWDCRTACLWERPFGIWHKTTSSFKDQRPGTKKTGVFLDFKCF